MRSHCFRISLTQLHQPSTQVKVALVKLKAIKNEAVAIPGRYAQDDDDQDPVIPKDGEALAQFILDSLRSKRCCTFLIALYVWLCNAPPL